jgi:hypothetical protein
MRDPALGIQAFRYAEVHENRPVIRLLQHDVVRLDVTVDQAMFMRVLQCREHRNGDLQGPGRC